MEQQLVPPQGRGRRREAGERPALTSGMTPSQAAVVCVVLVLAVAYWPRRCADCLRLPA